MALDVSVPASTRPFATNDTTTLLPNAVRVPAGHINPASYYDLLALMVCLLISLWVWTEMETRTATAASEIMSGHLQSYSRFRVPAVPSAPVSRHAETSLPGAERAQ